MQRRCPLVHGDSRQLLIAFQMGIECEIVGGRALLLLYFAVSWAVLWWTLYILFFLESMRYNSTEVVPLGETAYRALYVKRKVVLSEGSTFMQKIFRCSPQYSCCVTSSYRQSEARGDDQGFGQFLARVLQIKQNVLEIVFSKTIL